MYEITTSGSGSNRSQSRRTLHRTLAFGVMASLIAGCGGGSDTAATTTTLAPPTTVAITTTTVATTTPTSVVYVTEGAVVGVANASRINGAATRMSDRLAEVGFQMGPPTNYALGQLETTVIYFVPGDAAAQAVATSLRDALGGGAITLAEMPTPPPIDTGDLGNVTVLVAMGNDVSDKTLNELQGVTTTPGTGSTGSTGSTGGTATGDSSTAPDTGTATDSATTPDASATATGG